MPASMYLGWHRPPTVATEPDEYLLVIVAETGYMMPYIDLASPTNPTLITGMTE